MADVLALVSFEYMFCYFGQNGQQPEYAPVSEFYQPIFA